jgi:hypothetical protein
MAKQEFAVCYDYGTGGLWWLIEADSPDQLRSLSPELTVFDPMPAWASKGFVEDLWGRRQILGSLTDPVLLEIIQSGDEVKS